MNHGLVDAVDRLPGEVAADDLRPEGVSLVEQRVQVEELDAGRLVAEVEDAAGATHGSFADDRHRQTRQQHAEGLQIVSWWGRLITCVGPNKHGAVKLCG